MRDWKIALRNISINISLNIYEENTISNYRNKSIPASYSGFETSVEETSIRFAGIN